MSTPSTSASSTPAASTAVDYQGDWGGRSLAGTVKYCGSTANPYWGADITNGVGFAFLAYDIPPGSTEPVEAEVVTGFTDPDWTEEAKGTGQFVPGSPPHFIIVNGEGTFDITLQVGDFCNQ